MYTRYYKTRLSPPRIPKFFSNIHIIKGEFIQCRKTKIKKIMKYLLS